MIRTFAHWEAHVVTGSTVAIDVVRAFTTAAYAFGAGATAIHLAESLTDVYRLLDAHPTWVAMGENCGLRPERFALSNSPVHAAEADLDGRTVVQRTSAGTRGAFSAKWCNPLLCASLVVASASCPGLVAANRNVNCHAPWREPSNTDDLTTLRELRGADLPRLMGGLRGLAQADDGLSLSTEDRGSQITRVNLGGVGPQHLERFAFINQPLLFNVALGPEEVLAVPHRVRHRRQPALVAM